MRIATCLGGECPLGRLTAHAANVRGKTAQFGKMLVFLGCYSLFCGLGTGYFSLLCICVVFYVVFCFMFLFDFPPVYLLVFMQTNA